jgi:hypothetical protein
VGIAAPQGPLRPHTDAQTRQTPFGTSCRSEPSWRPRRSSLQPDPTAWVDRDQRSPCAPCSAAALVIAKPVSFDCRFTPGWMDGRRGSPVARTSAWPGQSRSRARGGTYFSCSSAASVSFARPALLLLPPSSSAASYGPAPRSAAREPRVEPPAADCRFPRDEVRERDFRAPRIRGTIMPWAIGLSTRRSRIPRSSWLRMSASSAPCVPV